MVGMPLAFRSSASERCASVADMDIHFTRSGGFAGRTTTARFEEPLPEGLKRLVEAARFFELPGHIGTSPRGADRYRYTVTVSEGPRAHTVIMSDGAIPEALQPLIDYLSTRAGAGGASPG